MGGFSLRSQQLDIKRPQAHFAPAAFLMFTDKFRLDAS
jgi:hypothetical protein